MLPSLEPDKRREESSENAKRVNAELCACRVLSNFPIPDEIYNKKKYNKQLLI
ncbi:hypothetical protein Hanom_Chr09g00851361 [Helianthus anomalus]